MKKLLALTLSAVMLVSLFSACGNVEPEVTTDGTTTAQTTFSETTTESTTSETTEATTETTEATTETTTETSEETTAAETEPAALPVTPESVWNGVEELYVAAVPAFSLEFYDIENIDGSYVKYYISDPEILENVKTYLSDAHLTETEEEGSFGRGSHNYCIGSSDGRNFKVLFHYGTEADAIYEKTYVFCDGEKSNNYVMSDEAREYIGKIISECVVGSVKLGTEFSDRSEWGEKSEESATVTVGMRTLPGYETEIVDRFEFVYDVREQCILDGLSACLAPENMTEGSVLPGVEPTFSVELPNGVVYKGYCFVGENGRLTVEDVLFTESDGGRKVFVLNEEACVELSELVESFSVMSAEKWENE